MTIEGMMRELENHENGLGVVEEYVRETRAALVAMRLALTEAKRATAKPEPVKQAPPTPTVDEYIASASSATAIWKALEPEYKVDRRTLLARVERVVKAYDLEDRFPYWSTDLKLARYLAEKVDGKRRLDTALDGLKVAVK